jgi:hypothetical protein
LIRGLKLYPQPETFGGLKSIARKAVARAKGMARAKNIARAESHLAG